MLCCINNTQQAIEQCVTNICSVTAAIADLRDTRKKRAKFSMQRGIEKKANQNSVCKYYNDIFACGYILWIGDYI